MSKRRSSDPRRLRAARIRRVVWYVILGLVVVGAAVGIVLTATRSAGVQAVQKAIVGNWILNEGGGEIDFHAGGVGHIPAAADLPAYDFGYYFLDSTHLVMNVAGKPLTVHFVLAGDTLTWYSPEQNVTYVYTRAK
jgi:hypothetical protein